MWHVEDVEVFLWNTPEGCNAMYVKDIKDGKRTYTHILAHNFLNIELIFNQEKVLRNWDLEFLKFWWKFKLQGID